MDDLGRLGKRLEAVWAQQKRYNDRVKLVQPDITDWWSAYLLGAIGEVDEVQRERHVKRHRRYTEPIRPENVAHELADLTKYVLSMWQELGYTAEQMLAEMQSKGDLLDLRLEQEFFPPLGTRVLVSDLDGTGADFRKGFADWLHQPTETVRSLAVDLDNGIPFGKYENIKGEFEAQGGYARLPAYADWVRLLRWEQEIGTWILIATARPAERFKRIGADTMEWLERQRVRPNAVLWGRDERVIELLRLGERNQVVLLEDDPTIARRAANAGVPVLLRRQPYNASVEGELIMSYDEFPNALDWEELAISMHAWDEAHKEVAGE